ncbi:MAG: IclR family transcriptional regulator [Sporichthyaceae bacterium]|nr:IclR family transcriptional regulator [Sporichthyaceae bacterium]
MRKERPAAENGQVRALTRGLDVLALFDAEHTELAQSEIAQALALPLPTVHRLCGTLVRQGFLAKDHGHRRLRLGPEILRLAGPLLAALGATELARAVLRELAEATGETASLATLVGSEVVYLDSAPGAGMLAPRASTGMRVPAHCTALGKCLLAQLDPEQARRQLGAEPYPGRTATTMTSWAALGPALAEIRQHGVAVSHEEYEQGLLAVAVAMPAQPSGQPMAIDLCIPAVRGTDEVVAASTKRLRDAAAELTASRAR